ncbi:hypothetical protein DM860_002336 [Cuscuta australis]|uniref:Phosphate transporter PHO1 n=1 Tax=Cuscuta australis TaxID=267555 RepID=A0A328D136_9ASTE|nr:hypothetical protein DM860_002336 [Cuscuta australis]
MVKFSKELEAQLIPEWKDAFVNYWNLKKHVKKIKFLRRAKSTVHPGGNGDFGRSIFDPVRAFVQNFSGWLPTAVAGKSETNRTSEVSVFFEKLDEELKKVNEFYKNKESEFVERGDNLKKQLHILLDLKRLVNDRRRKTLPRSMSASSGSNSDHRFDFSDNGSEYCGSPEARNNATPETESGVAAAVASRAKKAAEERKTTALRIDIPATTPTRAISAVTSMVWEDLTAKEGGGEKDIVSTKKTQCAEKMIRMAFVELYRGLGLLKIYSSLNMVAFVKILKKFDKVSKQQASTNYLKLVKRSYFTSSDKVVRLMDEVESLFTQHFAKNDRKRAMKFLRPQHHKDSHVVSFFSGLFTGCFVTLFGVYGILAHLSGMFSTATTQDAAAYVETVYPIFSIFALLSLHVFLYGCNLFAWRSTRINVNFIFEFQPKTALKYRDAFLICTSLMTAVLGAMVLHLILFSRGFSSDQKLDVLMADFFMADQLTSQIPLLRHMESSACYFLAGSFKTHKYETCKSGRMFTELAYLISFAPYYWRAAQCARRWLDEDDASHLANFGKYLSAMVAAGARLTYARQPESQLWLAIVLATSSTATVYQLYWDFVKDWGFFNLDSKNTLLRDDLVLKNKIVYYVSIALNFVLRLAWVETVMRFNVGVFESRLLDFSLASLEVIRRGHWNFYRLENEHLNNVGKFRAVKAVPLPFRETDSDV